MAATTPPPENACAYVVGDNGLSQWNETFADAWIGLLQTQRQLTRELDAELEARHGLGLSGLELLGRHRLKTRLQGGGGGGDDDDDDDDDDHLKESFV